ncbi:beta/alpha barrel domain-containing protein [Aureispira anguillae]|uniref:Isopentenyl-diphosphate delta-isomerase n=1 Tax=Aureispira anguillae TaxID=2864201 RepID=A0A915YJ24_9BACT|nr:isopentenyl-diphosphate delta-isomerase [Aureispira anguillae]BDS14018.1 isopentenyl-diphosphate delta-isomerase [Aureispira anguillae]
MENGFLEQQPYMDNDLTASSRKQDHIQLAFQSQVASNNLDNRFYYEPLLSGHPTTEDDTSFTFLGKDIQAPLWVSSMTGGTEYANLINHNLARAARDFGFGMGLGSCRGLLTSNQYLQDFDVRDIIGDHLPLYANLGIAQIEQLFDENKQSLIQDLVSKLRADGLIIHVNPFQEWLQPEGDHFQYPPIDTIKRVIDAFPTLKLIVKEVGQGMGYKSLEALFQLPIMAVDFAANGGTNFAKLELLRSDAQKHEIYAKLANIGHSAEEMINMSNQIIKTLGKQCLCKEVIISGGIKDFLDGYYLINKLSSPAIYGQASAFLKHARGNYEELYAYVSTQVEGLKLAKKYLTVK